MSILEGVVRSKTKPVLAKAIETTPEALIVVMESGSVSIPWAKCSESRDAEDRRARQTASDHNPNGTPGEGATAPGMQGCVRGRHG